MSDADYLNCSCQQCGEHIEFSPSAAGELIDCPHCGRETRLILSSKQSPTKPGIQFAVIAGSILIIIGFVAAWVGSAFMRMKASTASSPAVPGITNAVIPKDFTDMNGFQISKITLKKAENGGLVNALGTVKNDADRQRFGVKIILDLLDAQGEKIGTASDYVAVLEPHQELQFSVLLTEPNAVKAMLADIIEQK